MITVYRVDWEESERNWGVRPDGYSLHITQDDASHFIEDYWRTMPDFVPDEYSRPASSPYLENVTYEVYELIQSTSNGLRKYS